MDFEEVVRLDKVYIENWDIGLDIKILFKTVMVVVKERWIYVILYCFLYIIMERKSGYRIIDRKL